MKRSPPETAGFSLVEVTLALGVAAFSLLVLLGLLPTGLKTQQSSIQQTTANQIISTVWSNLRADIRLPPGLASKVCGDDPGPCAWGDLHGHWQDVAVPYTLYFTNEAKQTGTLNGDPPADAVFKATIIYRFPPSETTALADITVTWPAQGGVPTGSVTSVMAVNRCLRDHSQSSQRDARGGPVVPQRRAWAGPAGRIIVQRDSHSRSYSCQCWSSH